MKRTLLFICSLILSANLSQAQNSTSSQDMDFADQKFKPGQIWQYEARDHEAESRVIILKVEKANDQVMVHIAVMDTKIKTPQPDGGFMTHVGHLPFSKASLEKSLTKLESVDNELPDFIDGYNQWRQAFDTGQAGVFTISVKEAVAYVEKVMNQ